MLGLVHGGGDKHKDSDRRSAVQSEDGHGLEVREALDGNDGVAYESSGSELHGDPHGRF